MEDGLHVKPWHTRELLVVFAKYWQPGAVKTRLAEAVGAEPASRLSREFLLAVVRRMESLPCAKQICFAPDHCQTAFAELAGGAWMLEPQGDGDLGGRLRRCCEAALARGVNKLVVIGTDSPNVPTEYIEQAFDELSRFPVVLGSSDDGGYYLLGLSGLLPPIFEGIAWSTGEVWRQTTVRLTDARLPFACLPSWYDVDRVADLRRLLADLATCDERELRELRQRLLEILAPLEM